MSDRDHTCSFSKARFVYRVSGTTRYQNLTSQILLATGLDLAFAGNAAVIATFSGQFCIGFRLCSLLYKVALPICVLNTWPITQQEFFA